MADGTLKMHEILRARGVVVLVLYSDVVGNIHSIVLLWYHEGEGQFLEISCDWNDFMTLTKKKDLECPWNGKILGLRYGCVALLLGDKNKISDLVAMTWSKFCFGLVCSRNSNKKNSWPMNEQEMLRMSSMICWLFSIVLLMWATFGTLILSWDGNIRMGRIWVFRDGLARTVIWTLHVAKKGGREARDGKCEL